MPEKVLPVCVIFQVVLPIIEADKPAPIMEPVESDVLPSHVPVMLAEAPGLVGEDVLPPQAVAVTAATKTIAVRKRIKPLLLIEPM